MWHPKQYCNRHVVVLGLAKSGAAVAKLFHQWGAEVVVNDKKERNLCPEADELEALGIAVICGSHPETLVHPGVSLLVKNPGIPYSIAPVRQAERLGIEIVTEVEVAYHLCPAPIIGITGSNGKTTTTTLVGKMLEEAGLKPIVAGNIGTPLSEAVLAAKAENWMVVELSSFQLKGTVDFRPRIACLTNVYETHLDYHKTMDDYFQSKMQLFANQTAEDTAVLNWDNPPCREFIPHIKADVLPFSLKEKLAAGVYLRADVSSPSDGTMIAYADRTGREYDILPVRELGLPGRHNVENALAATAVAISAGAGVEAIAQALRTFRGVEHRLEFVRRIAGIDFYNGSKATNPAATIVDIEAFAQRPVVLIAGGLDRGMEYTDLAPHFRDHVKAVVALGETKEKITRVAREAGVARIASIENGGDSRETLAAAVNAAFAFAQAGDVVLLSPACASWDMFPSYEVRGRMFKESVHNL